MKTSGEQNVYVSWQIIVFYVVYYFESLLDGLANTELRFNATGIAHLLPDVFVHDAPIELRVL